MITPYENLANAIIEQAVRDYRNIQLWLKAHRPLLKEDRKEEKYVNKVAEKKSTEAFFKSQWFGVLTDLDGKSLLKKLKKEVL